MGRTSGGRRVCGRRARRNASQRGETGSMAASSSTEDTRPRVERLTEWSFERERAAVSVDDVDDELCVFQYRTARRS